jgi:hypothetical protein
MQQSSCGSLQSRVARPLFWLFELNMGRGSVGKTIVLAMREHRAILSAHILRSNCRNLVLRLTPDKDQ